MKLYLASNNEHKRREFEELLPEYEIILPKDEGYEFNPVEDGKSFIENALIKAEELYRIIGKPCIADDSGLCVDAFGGKPGIHTARYGEEGGRRLTDKEKYTLLLKNMEGLEDRKARFVCTMVLIVDEHNKYVVEKSVEGRIVREAEGEGGFGYDPVFYNEEAMAVSANLTVEEKNTYSHRAKAANAIKKILEMEKETIWKEMNRI